MCPARCTGLIELAHVGGFILACLVPAQLLSQEFDEVKHTLRLRFREIPALLCW